MADPKTHGAAAFGAQTNVDLETLGLSEWAYLRPAVENGVAGYAIYAANGVAIGFAHGRDAAIAAVMTNDMDVAELH